MNKRTHNLGGKCKIQYRTNIFKENLKCKSIHASWVAIKSFIESHVILTSCVLFPTVIYIIFSILPQYNRLCLLLIVMLKESLQLTHQNTLN